jgi:hypothetical protein
MIRANKTMICIICFDEIKEETRKLNCVHAFHEGCIEKWYKRSHRCPLCRKSKFDMKCEEFETHYFKEAKKIEDLIDAETKVIFRV